MMMNRCRRARCPALRVVIISYFVSIDINSTTSDVPAISSFTTPFQEHNMYTHEVHLALMHSILQL
jgi:hypothetical protein